jgi:methionine-rich copper-binding protein CopC
MKLLNLTLLAAAISMSVQAFAHDKITLTEDAAQAVAKANVSRADFLGLESIHYVKTAKGVQKAQALSKNQQLVTESGSPFGTLTGQLVVKLKEDVDAAAFAKSKGLKLEWQSNNNLVILATPENAELLSVLEAVKASDSVVRAKLDRAVNKNEIH